MVDDEMKAQVTNNYYPTIYIIDNDLACHTAFLKGLENREIKVRCFASARNLLQHTAAENVVCLVIEANLPDCSGIELLEKLNGDGLNVPVIFVSSESDVRGAVKAMQANALDFIEKPFHPSVLMKHIDPILELSAQHLG